MRIENLTQALKWYNFNDLERPLTHFKVTPYLRNGTIHSYNENNTNRDTHAILKGVISNDLE